MDVQRRVWCQNLEWQNGVRIRAGDEGEIAGERTTTQQYAGLDTDEEGQSIEFSEDGEDEENEEPQTRQGWEGSLSNVVRCRETGNLYVVWHTKEATAAGIE